MKKLGSITRTSEFQRTMGAAIRNIFVVGPIRTVIHTRSRSSRMLWLPKYIMPIRGHACMRSCTPSILPLHILGPTPSVIRIASPRQRGLGCGARQGVLRSAYKGRCRGSTERRYRRWRRAAECRWALGRVRLARKSTQLSPAAQALYDRSDHATRGAQCLNCYPVHAPRGRKYRVGAALRADSGEFETMSQLSFRSVLPYNSFVSPLVASHACTFKTNPWVSVSQAFTLTPSPMQLSNSSAY